MSRLVAAKKRFDELAESLNDDDRALLSAYAGRNGAQEVSVKTPKVNDCGPLSSKEVFDRFSVLGTLMVFQSLSSFILSSYQEFIEKNIYITLYLTMLVGAGGNAGNQSTVMVIRQMVSIAFIYANRMKYTRVVGVGLDTKRRFYSDSQGSVDGLGAWRDDVCCGLCTSKNTCNISYVRFSQIIFRRTLVLSFAGLRVSAGNDFDTGSGQHIVKYCAACVSSPNYFHCTLFFQH